MWNDQGPTHKPIAYIGRRRRDGKFPVLIVYHAKRLNKIFTAEKVQEIRASGDYNVIG